MRGTRYEARSRDIIPDVRDPSKSDAASTARSLHACNFLGLFCFAAVHFSGYASTVVHGIKIVNFT